MNTIHSRYLINNDLEGDVYFVTRKRDAIKIAKQWAKEDRITYYVYDRMARHGMRRLWQFDPSGEAT